MATRVPAAVLALVLACAPAAAQVTGSNGYYDVTVNSLGEYTAVTGPLHPNAGLNVFYGGFIPLLGTTWNTVRSYDSSREWVLRNNARTSSAGFSCATLSSASGPVLFEPIPGPGGTAGARNTWVIDDRDDQLTITQEIVAEGATLGDSAVRVTLCVRNDAALDEARVGLRFLWDWQMAGVDGPFLGLRPPHPPFEPFLSREQDFALPAFDYYDMSNTQNPSVDPPFYRIGGSITAPPRAIGPTPPDLLQYVSWPAAKDRCFEYATTGATVGATSGSDSAVLYSWGLTPATAITLGPGEEWCATQHVFVFIEEPPVECRIIALAFGGITCGAPEAIIDAAASGAENCPGILEYRYSDPAGTVRQDWTTEPTAPADVEGTWIVDVRCDVEPTCTDSTLIDVVIEQPPALFSGSVTDVFPCNLGLEIAWDRASWADAAGGVYDLHRSESSCADALASPAIRIDVPWGVVQDVTTREGAEYHYVIVAESLTPARVCLPVGPRGGAIATLCLGPMLERADPTPPSPPCWGLRVSHVGDTVKLDWSLARPLGPGDHVHAWKAPLTPTAGWVLMTPEDYIGTTWSDTDTSASLQFFDVRHANECEIESPDDEPPGWDPPTGVACP